MKIKAVYVEKVSLEQMVNVRDGFYKDGPRKGKMPWKLIDIEEVLHSLGDDNIMVFTQKFGEVDSSDEDKIKSLLTGLPD